MSGSMPGFPSVLPKHLVSVGTVFLLLISPLAAQTIAEQAAWPTDENFRRIFVPADSPELWPTGQQHFLPVKKEQFLAEIQTNRALRQNFTSARNVRAMTRAQLSGDTLLVGETTFNVELPDLRARILPLDPWNMAIRSANWVDPTSKPARLGLWNRGSADSQFGVLVSRSAMLRVDWQLSAHTTTAERLQFRLELPSVVPHTFEILLPENFQATLNAGQLIETTLPDEGKKIWRFQLAGSGPYRLEVIKLSDEPSQQGLQLASQSTTYRVEPDVLHVTTSIRLERSVDPSQMLRCEAPGNLQITSCQQDQQPIDWHVEDSRQRTLVSLALQPSDRPRTLEIEAVVPLRLGRPWRLSALRPVSAQWTEGTALLIVSPDLELQSLVPDSATLEQVVGVQDRIGSQEVYRLQEWSADASMEIVVRRRQARPEVRVVTTVDLGPAETTARIAAKFSSQDQTTFQFEAEIAEDWSIESVNADPAGAIREWHVAGSNERPQLQLQLSRPVSPDAPLRVEFDARANRTKPVYSAKAKQLEILRFSTAETRRHLVLLRGYQKESLELLHGLESARVELSALNPDELALLPDPAVGELIDLHGLADEQVVAWRPRRTRYNIRAISELQLLPHASLHRTQIRCEPISGAVSEISLRFEQPLPATAQWKLVEKSGKHEVQSISQPFSGQAAENDRFTTTLKLPFAVREPTTLQLSYSMPLAEVVRYNAIRFPEADHARGQVVIRGSISDWRIEDSDWTPLSAPVGEFVESSSLPVLGCYRILPTHSRRSLTQQALGVTRTESTHDSALLVSWLAEVHTQQSSLGTAITSTVYYLENSGASSAEFIMPPGAELLACWVDQQPIETNSLLTPDGSLRVPLQEGNRYPTLALKVATRGTALGLSTKIEPSLPECSFPVHRSRWTLWTSADSMSDDLAFGYPNQQLPWRQRWFGPLARPANQKIFNPFRLNDWSRLGAASAETANMQANPKQSLVENFFVDEHALGRRAGSIEFGENTPSVTIRRAYVQQAVWGVVWIVSTVLGNWWLARKTGGILAAIALAAAICLVMPAQWLAIAQAILVGLLSAVAVGIVFKRPSQEQLKKSTALLTLSRLGMVLCVFSLLEDGRLYAVPPSDNIPRATKVDLPTVLIPIDANGNPQGDDVYLPESFWNRLQSKSDNAAYDYATYGIFSAHYLGALKDDASTQSDTSEPWIFSCRIESFSDNCRVQLPWKQEDAQWIAERHSLDGKPIAIDWNAEGKGCSFELVGKGTHQLQLFFHPKIKSTAGRSTLQMNVPRVPVANLELDVSESVKNLQIAGVGEPVAHTETGRLATPLPPADILRLDWTTEPATNSHIFQGELEQYSWLHVDKNKAKLQVQLHLHEEMRSPQTLLLEISPQLTLLPEDHPEIENIHIAKENPNLVTIKLKPYLGDQQRVTLQFRLQRTRSSGTIPFPSVQLKGVEAARTLFAVSVGPGLSYSEKLRGSFQGISDSEFLAEWGDAPQLPLIAYAVPENRSDWSLQVWPDPQSFSASSSLKLHCGLDGARVGFSAAVDRVTGKLLLHELTVPETLGIDRITLVRQGSDEPVPVRWSRPHGTRVVVFFSRPLTESHILHLEGHLRASSEGKMGLPQIVLKGAERSENRLELFRNPEVMVRWSDPKNVPEELPQQDILRNALEVLVGQYVWRSSDFLGKQSLALSKNQHRFTADTITTIHQDETIDRATLHVRLRGRQGVVTHCKLRVPSTFQKPFSVQPASVAVVDQRLSQQSDSHLLLLLAEPLQESQEIDLQITGEIVLPADQRRTFPQLKIINASGGRQYVLLPSQLGNRSVEWQNTVGLKRESIPDTLQEILRSEKGVPFRVVAEDYSVQERSYQGPLRNATLQVTWLDGVLDDKANLSVTATFLLQPGRASHCSVRLPAGAKLTQIVGNNQPMIRQKKHDGTWRIALGPPFLPRVIQVSYQSKAKTVGRQLELYPPDVLIGDQPLPRASLYWQLRPVGGLRIGNPVAGWLMDREEFFQTIHREVRVALENALPLAIELPREEVRPWLRDWALYEQRLAQALRLNIETTPHDAEAAMDWPKLLQQYGMLDSPLPENYGDNPLIPPHGQTLEPTSGPTHSEIFLSGNSEGILICSLDPVILADIWRWFAAAAIVVVGLIWERNSPGLFRNAEGAQESFVTLTRNRRMFLAGAGVVWWLLFSPSIVGLLLVAATLVSIVHQVAKTRRRAVVSKASSHLTMQGG